jgi:hypothetical protein
LALPATARQDHAPAPDERRAAALFAHVIVVVYLLGVDLGCAGCRLHRRRASHSAGAGPGGARRFRSAA